jgi:hypothetical protein
MSSRLIRNALAPLLADRLGDLGYPTLFFAPMPRKLERAILPNGRFDAASIEVGDADGGLPLDVAKDGGGNSWGRENALYMKEYTFRIRLYKDARYYDRDDVMDELEAMTDLLMSIQSIEPEQDWGAVQRHRDPTVVSIEDEIVNYGDYAAWWGTLVVGYTAERTVEEV